MAHYHRPIKAEPPRVDERRLPGLVCDLTDFLGTLRAARRGTEMATAAAALLGPIPAMDDEDMSVQGEMLEWAG